MLEKLTAADFQDLVDRQFQITYADYQEALTLKSVEAKRKSPVPGRFRDPFSLIFDGSSTEVLLPQRIHPLKHATLGYLEIFLVPIGRNPNGTHLYQAVFA